MAVEYVPATMPERERAESGEYVETVTQENTLAALRSVDERVATTREVADALGCSLDAARNKLNELHEQDRVERKQVGARAVVWWIPDTGKMEGVSRRHGDDYYGENPDWADDLPDLGENA